MILTAVLLWLLLIPAIAVLIGKTIAHGGIVDDAVAARVDAELAEMLLDPA